MADDESKTVNVHQSSPDYSGFGCAAMIISVAVAYAIVEWAWQGFPGVIPK